MDDINGLFTEEGILQNGDKLKEISVFEHDGLTNLVFHIEGVDLNIGKLAVWRLNTHGNFGGTWLSDYLSNKFGAHVQKSIENGKPGCPLIVQNGNVFHLMGVASRTLRENGLAVQAKEMCDRIHSCGGYDEAIGIMGGVC